MTRIRNRGFSPVALGHASDRLKPRLQKQKPGFSQKPGFLCLSHHQPQRLLQRGFERLEELSHFRTIGDAMVG